MQLAQSVRSFGTGSAGNKFTPGPWEVNGTELVDAATQRPIPTTVENLALIKSSPQMFGYFEQILGCLHTSNGTVDQASVQRVKEIALAAIRQATIVG